MPIRRALVILLALAASGALAACGGDDTVDAGPAAEPTPVAEPVPAEASPPAEEPAPPAYGSGDPPAEEPAPAEPPAEAPAPAEAEAATTLVGSVGPGFTITLTVDGEPVSALPAGSYTIEVDDMAGSHNFHLTGPGVEEATEVAETGKATWEVTLEAGEYTFLCDPHASSMVGGFTVS